MNIALVVWNTSEMGLRKGQKSLKLIRETEFIRCICGFCDEWIPRLTARGKPNRYQKGHHTLGKIGNCLGQKRTAETKNKQRLIHLGDKNPMWKADEVGYNALHAWVNRNLKKPDTCELCNEVKEWLDLANVTGIYNRDFNNWQYLCRKCHMESDGRLQKLVNLHKRCIDLV